jgi:hypothetical protein
MDTFLSRLGLLAPMLSKTEESFVILGASSLLKGLSLSLHARICKEISIINPKVNVLKIRPLQAMKKIILAKVKNVTYEGDLANENEWYEPTLYIPLESIFEHLIE